MASGTISGTRLSNGLSVVIHGTMDSEASRTSGRVLVSKLCCFTLLAGLLSGCAWTRTPVQMSLAPQINQPVRKPLKVALEVAPVKDTRPVSGPLVLIQKQNAYGKTTGAYVTPKPVAEIFREGLETALKQNGFETTNGTPYLLESTIQGFDSDVIAGIWEGTFIAKVTARFELVNQTNNLPVWHDTYIGQDRVRAAIGTGQLVADSFTRASDDVIRQLISDPAFRRCFEQ